MKSFHYIQGETAARKMVTTPHTAVGLMAALEKARETERERWRERKKTARTVAPLHCYVKWLAVPLFYLQILSLIIKPPHILHVPHPRSSPCEIN